MRIEGELMMDDFSNKSRIADVSWQWIQFGDMIQVSVEGGNQCGVPVKNSSAQKERGRWQKKNEEFYSIEKIDEG